MDDKDKREMFELTGSKKFFYATIVTIVALFVGVLILLPQLQTRQILVFAPTVKTPELLPFKTKTPTLSSENARRIVESKVAAYTATATSADQPSRVSYITVSPISFYPTSNFHTATSTPQNTPTVTPNENRIVIETPFPTVTRTPTLTRTPSNTPTPTPTVRPPNSYGPGVFHVPDELRPGRYKGYVDDWCYWAKLDANGNLIIGDVVRGYLFVVDVYDSEFFSVSPCYVTLLWTFTATPTYTLTPTDIPTSTEETPTEPPTVPPIVQGDEPTESPTVPPVAP